MSWAVGHLVGLADATAYGDFAKWRAEDLPIVPTQWVYKVNDSTAYQYNNLRELLHNPTVSSVIAATDAGREGELIFRLIYNQSGCKKPCERLWISSLEASDIAAGMKTLKPLSHYDSLYQAASARQCADWLVGINYSRWFSCLYNKSLSVGRVQTPVLALVTQRDKEIADFTPKEYYIISTMLNGLLAQVKANSQREAAAIKERSEGHDALVTTVKQDDVTKSAPSLFNLSALQAAASKRLGYTAQQTLDLAQVLYEKRLLTYPRTSSRYISKSVLGTMAQRINNLKLPEYEEIIAALLVKGIPDIANDEKVTDHHAIIPTTTGDPEAAQLTKSEAALYKLVCCQTLAALSPPYQYTALSIMWDINGEAFKSTAQKLKDMGWMAILGDDTEEKQTALPRPIAEGESAYCTSCDIERKQTTPPQHYTDGTLIDEMCHIGKRIGVTELKDAISEGLGTEATRAGIIEKLLKMEYIKRNGKQLEATDKGRALLTIVPTELKDALLTAEWEQKLTTVETGGLSAAEFESEITKSVKSYIEARKQYNDIPDPTINFNHRESLGKCPVCGGHIYDGKKNFHCENRECPFAIWKTDPFWTNKGKTLSSAQAKALLEGKSVLFKDCTGKNNTTYDARISMSVLDGKAKYNIAFVDKQNKKSKENER